MYRGSAMLHSKMEHDTTRHHMEGPCKPYAEQKKSDIEDCISVKFKIGKATTCCELSGWHLPEEVLS
jgi:hypothetical protein